MGSHFRAAFIVVCCLYFVTIEACGYHGHLSIGQNMYLESPYYPNSFGVRGGDFCHWRFSTPVNTIIHLNCNVFDIRQNISECMDIFSFSPSGDLKSGDGESHCGMKHNLKRYTTTNSFDAYFSSWAPYSPKQYIPSRRRFHCMITVSEVARMQPECGKRNPTSRIVGGEQTGVHEWPWQVEIRRLTSYGNEHHCGGSLISTNWVLTAAHCVQKDAVKVDQLFVSIGEHIQNTGEDTNHTVHRYIRNIIIHEDYFTSGRDDYMDAYNDIAVLQLERPVEYNDAIIPVCLPTTSRTQTFAGENSILTGWGSTYEGDMFGSDILQEVEVSIITNSQCATLNSPEKNIWENHICAYSKNKDSCKGDSGGPLVWLDDSGRYQQIGIVSYGLGCALEGRPGIYTRVTSYIDWIRTATNASLCWN